jgi:hypothetical protein
MTLLGNWSAKLNMSTLLEFLNSIIDRVRLLPELYE